MISLKFSKLNIPFFLKNHRTIGTNHLSKKELTGRIFSRASRVDFSTFLKFKISCMSPSRVRGNRFSGVNEDETSHEASCRSLARVFLDAKFDIYIEITRYICRLWYVVASMLLFADNSISPGMSLKRFVY